MKVEVKGEMKVEMKIVKNPSVEYLTAILKKSEQDLQELQAIDLDKILAVFDKVSKLWNQEGQYLKRAKMALEGKHFSSEMNDLTLSYVKEILRLKTLKTRVKKELPKLEDLENENIEYRPIGNVLHITAGNVFLGFIDNLLTTILSKNICYIKLSSSNSSLPQIFLESLIEADTEKIILPYIHVFHWKGGDEIIESFFKERVDAIVAWGGEEMCQNWRRNLSSHIKFIEHGPKLSFHVITKKSYEQMKANDFDKIAYDISLWDQSACANSQNIFIESGINIQDFIRDLSKAMSRFSIDPPSLSDNEYVEILKDRELANFDEFETGIQNHFSENFSILYKKGCVLTPTALNRTVHVKTFKDTEDLKVLKKFKYYLQTAGLHCGSKELDTFKNLLFNCGVKRITKIGEMLLVNTGAPHDGNFSLRELVEVVSSTVKTSIQSFALEMAKNLSFYNSNYEKFSQLPLIDGKILSKHSILTDNGFINNKVKGNIVYSSGGTTGAPKYSVFTNDEFEIITKLLANSYMNLGLCPSDRVGNLFMAANLWSSFNAIHQALAYCNVMQFPIGGQCAEALKYLEQFKVNVVFGVPSLLVNMALESKGLKINKIFYAGEVLTQSHKKVLFECWGTQQFYSAGYASVDVGPIGYQDLDCSGSEHYLFEDLVHLEVINEEAVVTSKIRQAMPIIRYKTGDRVEIISKENGKTKFKILGRTDSLINIWGCRFYFEDLNSLFKKLLKTEDIYFQVELFESDEHKMKILMESELDFNFVSKEIYSHCQDIKQTISLQQFRENFILENTKPKLNLKTGKFKPVLDFRS